jgi:hypothetical protein
MPEWLTSIVGPSGVAPAAIGARLVAALVAGGAVAWIYRHTRQPNADTTSFPGTLVLLAVLIAMVTQVIGDNVARAFSLVGALSIVRFRTVVRDTQDTAFVIFAVAVGMAVGAGAPWVAGLGLVVVGAGAFALRPPAVVGGIDQPFTLVLRTGLGLDLEPVLTSALDPQLRSRQLRDISTTRQGTSLEVAYDIALATTASPDELVKRLYQLDGIHAVELRRRPDVVD